MNRKLAALCVMAAICAVLIISGCTSAPGTPKPSAINATGMPSASPGTYAGAGGYAENASGNASIAPPPGVTPQGVPAGVIGSNNTTAKK